MTSPFHNTMPATSVYLCFLALFAISESHTVDLLRLKRNIHLPGPTYHQPGGHHLQQNPIGYPGGYNRPPQSNFGRYPPQQPGFVGGPVHPTYNKPSFSGSQSQSSSNSQSNTIGVGGNRPFNNGPIGGTLGVGIKQPSFSGSQSQSSSQSVVGGGGRVGGGSSSSQSSSQTFSQGGGRGGGLSGSSSQSSSSSQSFGGGRGGSGSNAASSSSSSSAFGK